MAIFSVFIVLFIVDHLSMWFMFCVGAEAPLTFRVAILMFALFFGWVRLVVSPSRGGVSASDCHAQPRATRRL
jgi:hypothetical protein